MRENRSLTHQLLVCVLWLLAAYVIGHFIGLKLLLLLPAKDKVAIAGVFLRIVGGLK